MRLPNLRPRTLGFIAAAFWLSAMALNALHAYHSAPLFWLLCVSTMAMFPFGLWGWIEVLLLLLRIAAWWRDRAHQRRRERAKRRVLRAIQELRRHGLSAPGANPAARKNHVEPPEPWPRS